MKSVPSLTNDELIAINTESDRLTNRHIAKLLSDVSAVGTPEIVQCAIKREMRRLSRDICTAVSDVAYTGKIRAWKN